MRKLTIGLVVVAIIAAGVVSLVPALCANGGANGDTCDLTAVLRGTVRLANAEVCRQTPATAGCQVASVAGLKK
ncbi:MAG: hypothetical protein HY870_10815 [Chloroflexi bacterium]|nr:hypothetical protein [Chloroflexota bacterium]